LPTHAQVAGLADSGARSGNRDASASRIQLGTNISWFTTWSEVQPLANVFPTSRGFPNLIPLDFANEPKADFQLLIYEGDKPGGLGGVGGGAQIGEHKGRFVGKATMSAQGGTLGNIRYDAPTNTTTFTFTTTKPGYSNINFTNTRRLPTDNTSTGLRIIEIMRPGHKFGELLNSAFVRAMEAFSAIRTTQNWDEWTYQTTVPVWANRAKPGGMYSTMDGITAGGAAWETLIGMANEMGKDLWISLPPNADDAYLTNIFRTFFYGSDGINPYTSVQENPVWAPLDRQRKLYFEIGNEIWNYAHPYVKITNQFMDQAEAEFDADDPHNYGYADPNYKPDRVQLMRSRVARLTAHASQLCRDVVGDENMMTRYRPVLSGQVSWSYPGLISLSYLKIVLGGHGWYRDDWTGDHFHGRFIPGVIKTPEDSASINQFGNVSHPLSYWIYGYAVAPYVDWTNAEELKINLDQVKLQIVENGIVLARQAGIEAMAYEGGIGNHTTRHDYQEEELYDVLVDLLNHWYRNGGGLFMNYSLAGNNGQGAIPDMTRQDPAEYPKIRALRHVVGLR